MPERHTAPVPIPPSGIMTRRRQSPRYSRTAGQAGWGPAADEDTATAAAAASIMPRVTILLRMASTYFTGKSKYVSG